MKKTLGGIFTAFVIVAVAIYLLELYVLKGDLLTESAIRPSDINPHPSLPLNVAEADSTVRMYLRSDIDLDYNLLVSGPMDEVVLEETITSNRTNVEFPVAEAGVYRVQISLDNPPGRAVWVKAYLNDNRIVYPLYARFFN